MAEIYQTILDTMKSIGESVSSISNKILSQVPVGFLTSTTTAKIFSVLIFLLVIYLILSFASSMRKPVKYLIVFALILLTISVVMTFVS